jgi:hypothetical protein
LNAQGQSVWTPGGVAVSTARDEQLHICLVPDGIGGAIIAWEDYRLGGYLADHHVYAQRVRPDGQLGVPTSVRDTPSAGALHLGMPTPNPNNDAVRVSLMMEGGMPVELRVYDVQGREVWSRVDTLPAGESFVVIPGTDRSGRTLPQGVYFISARSAGATATRKFTLLR